MHGLDPLACAAQEIWGYETTWGSFAQFCKVQAQQLLPKPKHLGWEGGAAYGLTYFTAYRMLMDRRKLQPGHRVLIWGAAGGLGVFATQLCKLDRRRRGRRRLQRGEGQADRAARRRRLHRPQRVRQGMMRRGDEDAEEERARFKESRRFCKAVEEKLGGPPDIVFEHVGKATFPTSVLCVRAVRQGRHLRRHLGLPARLRRALPVDAPEADHRLALRQRVGGDEGQRADRGVEGAARAVADDGLRGVADAHQLLRDNKHLGKIAILVGATEEGQGKTAEGPGAIRAEVGA